MLCVFNICIVALSSYRRQLQQQWPRRHCSAGRGDAAGPAREAALADSAAAFAAPVGRRGRDQRGRHRVLLHRGWPARNYVDGHSHVVRADRVVLSGAQDPSG